MSKIGLAVFILLMCLLDVVWIRHDAAPPRMFDDSMYLTESVDLYYTLRDHGVVRFVVDSLTPSRGAHPPMMKILPVPMYLALRPGTDAALYCYALLIPVFCVYIFLLARELVGQNPPALLAVIVTCLFPLTYGMWRNVMAEFGTAVATVGCLYHLVKCSEFRASRHSLLMGAFLGWGLLWKVSFPLFVAAPIGLILARGWRSHARQGVRFPARNVLSSLLVALGVAGPFYARSGEAVLQYLLLTSGTTYPQWGLGPVLSARTIVRYWLLVINWGISPFFFGLLCATWWLLCMRRRRSPAPVAAGFLVAWFLLPFGALSLHPLKEVRFLLPALPALGIAMATLTASLLAPMRQVLQVGVLVALSVWPLYLFVSSSFDSAFLPRKDIVWGPFIISTADLEMASLEWMPTYTFPANRTKWPTRETLEAISARAPSARPARVHVAGANPYFNGLVLAYEARLARSSLVFDSPFNSSFNGADFVIIPAPQRKYGPVDERRPQLEQELRNGSVPFIQVNWLALPDGGEIRIYEAAERPPAF
jgi:hypothetical protein